MSFLSLLRTASAAVVEAARSVRAVGFNAPIDAEIQPLSPEAIRQNQQALCVSIAAEPRSLRRYEASALMMLAAHGGHYRQQARAALWLAAKAAGRNVGPSATREPRLCKASTARLAYWATDRGTPV